MNQLKLLLERLSLRQKFSIVLVAVGVFGGIFAAARWNKERDFRPLYRNVASQDAGAVVNKLKEAGVDYRISDDGGTILVPSARVAELRLQMAAAGLPKTGRIGFELFDSTNFGATEFAEQVNYHRAVEGELERSVMALSEVESARVHVTFPKDSVFTETRQAAKASVMVRLRPGVRLAPANVTAICHLVASAVEGLQPEAVSVLDMQGNLLSRPRREAGPDGAESSDALLEYRQKVERDLLSKIHATLEPLLGEDKYRAGVSVECDFTSGEQSEETFDPSKSVMVSSQRTEEASGANGASGVPGTASNLPRPGLRPGAGGGTGVTRRTENTAYQSSRLVKRLRLPQGAVRKMSIAVLVDQAVQWEGVPPKVRKILVPPSPERLKVIRDVVAGVVGFQQDRGDQLMVETLPFESTLSSGPPEPPAPASPKQQTQSPLPPFLQQYEKRFGLPVLIGAAAGVLVLLLIVVVLLAVRMSSRKKVKVEVTGAVKGKAEAKGELPAPGSPTIEEQMQAKLAEKAAEQERQEMEMLSALAVPFTSTKKTEVLKKHIMEQAKKDPAALAHIVRTWLNDAEDR